MTTAETATAQCFPTFPIAPAETPLSGTHVWLTENPHPGFAASVTAGYRWLLTGNLLNAQGKRDCLSETGTRSRSWNMYSYALNNPLTFIDPSGLCYQDANGNYFDDDSVPCDFGSDGNPVGNSTVTVTDTAPPVDYDDSDTDDFLNLTFYADSFGNAFQVDAPQNLPPGTPQKYSGALKQGLDNARAALKRKRCADFYGGRGPQTLDATRYRFLDLGNPTTGAATISPSEVFINTNGAYMTYSPTIGQAGPFGRFWTQGQFRGFILLHELGHQLSAVTDFQRDAGEALKPLNEAQSRRVLAACF